MHSRFVRLLLVSVMFSVLSHFNHAQAQSGWPKLGEPSKIDRYGLGAANLTWPATMLFGVQADSVVISCNCDSCFNSVKVRVPESAIPALADDLKVVDIATMLHKAYGEWCATAQQRGWIPSSNVHAFRKVIIEAGVQYTVAAATLQDGGRRWDIYNDAKAREPARLAALRADQNKQTNKSSFSSRFGVEKWAGTTEISANPFQFKGQVVAVLGYFKKMISETEAVFGNLNARVDAADLLTVPLRATDAVFTQPNQGALLAVQVRGMRTVKAAGGEVQVPDIVLVGLARCQESSCAEYGKFSSEGKLDQ